MSSTLDVSDLDIVLNNVNVNCLMQNKTLRRKGVLYMFSEVIISGLELSGY